MTDIREEDDADEEYQAKLKNLETTLSKLPGGGIRSGTELSVQDDTQGMLSKPPVSKQNVLYQYELYVQICHYPF